MEGWRKAVQFRTWIPKTDTVVVIIKNRMIARESLGEDDMALLIKLSNDMMSDYTSVR